MNSESIQRNIKTIKNDSTHGSTIILSKIIDLIHKILSDSIDFSVMDLKKMLLTFINAHPTMAIIVNFSNDLLLFLENRDIKEKEDVEVLQTFLEHYTEMLNQSHKTIQDYFLQQFSSISSIATYSSSGTIQQCLELLYYHNQRVKIYCSESRPKNEGMVLAKELSKKGIQTYLMTDASFFSQLEHRKVVIIGSDAITRFGVINKMGTYPLACLAKQFYIPVYCVTSTHKLVPYDYILPKEQEKNSNEITGENQSNLNIFNYYFDTTPIELFSGYITERGLIGHKKIQEIIQEKRLHSSLK